VVNTRLSYEPLYRRLLGDALHSRIGDYLDLFPDWERGIIRLYDALGVSRYTHIYSVTGNEYNDNVSLIPIDQEPLSTPTSKVAYVSLLTIPKLEWTRIPSEPLLREGGGVDILVELWSIASSTYGSFYVKQEWRVIDKILFSARDENDKRLLVDVFTRQWAFAQEQRKSYREETWKALYRLLQNFSSLPY
jgi:hypothetical protein